MIKENLNSLIMESMKAGDKVRTNALRAIKTGIMQWETAEENIGKTINDDIELNIIRKLKNQYVDAAAQCNDGKHDDLVAENNALAKIMEEFLPAPVTEADIKIIVEEVIKGCGGAAPVEPIKKNMGLIIKSVRILLPNADGKLVSKVVGEHLN